MTLDIYGFMFYHIDMIIEIQKLLFNKDDDYSVFTPIGELMCKITALRKGYYIYNKLGEQIAQLTFDANVATLAIATRQRESTIVKLARYPEGRFAFLDEIYTKQDLAFIDNIKGKVSHKFSIWGDVLNYSYDIYDGKEVAASVVPSTTNENVYHIDLGARANILYTIMTALAIEKLNHDPLSKR